MENISECLLKVVNNCSSLQLHYDDEDKYFSIPMYFHGKQGYCLSFDPWNGVELRCTYDYEFVSGYKNSIKTEKKLWKKHRWACYLENSKLHEKELNEFLNKFGPIDSIKNRKWQDAQIKYDRDLHLAKEVCINLSYFLKGGEKEYITPIIHIPNIRTYAILNKRECGGFEPIKYCPFCGAEFPKRLDEKLSEILQSEYGLESWKDYEKAPIEFHSDKWWKKRKL
ncbi:MAG: hypothetical protein LBB11_01610 [Puniceicoccales bacterium]|jgi:hypothetical protein|nr:hypothetical protein [Puniceicoccales bacterium]